MKLINVRKFIKYFGKGRKLKLFGFFILSTIAAILEFAGIALIYPVILLMLNQESFINTKAYTFISGITHTSNSFTNALFVGTFVIFIFILKNIFMLTFLKLQCKFVTYWKRDIRQTFISYFLYTDQSENLKISYSNKAHICNHIVNETINSYIVRGINLVTSTIIITGIIGLLLWKFPLAAISAICFIFISLAIQNKFFKLKNIELGKQLNETTRDFNQNSHILYTNLKEIAAFSKQEFFRKRNLEKENRNAKLRIDSEYYTAIPPYIVEILVVIALFILSAVVSIQNPGDSSAMIASLAIVAAAVFRIAPALNRIQSSITAINIGREYVVNLIKYYEEFNLDNFKIPKEKKELKRLNFKDTIELENITFAYNKTPVIKNVSLTINKGDYIGIVGLSGAGKSTLADIIMGLLKPQSGVIKVDGITLNSKNYSNFREIISYVPQKITLLETSFRENVAWGIEDDKIDNQKVVESLEFAQLYDFVKTFKEGIYAIPIIDSDGISQGQKQRLAIARALYREPEIIIFDEATASLDVKIEHDITETINKKLAKEKTMIAIAHRLSTLKACNKIIYMRAGSIVDIGTFKELSKRYEDFNDLIKLSTIN